ncbi:MAG TPA: hypothetical protein PK082_00245 [Phycisphaerae bacterium]|nr:hypothetical protein [Phycisphaerae bacterium]
MSPRVKSIQELRRELQKKERRVTRLEKRRAKLAAELASLDREIASLAGGVLGMKRGPAKGAVKTRRARKRATGTPLVEYVAKALANAKGGLRVKDIMAAVQKAGYRSSSKGFYGIVAAAVREDARFKRLKRGIYTLAK